MKVSDRSKLLVPLFHGTSCVFMDSIRATGLGAQNPHSRLATLQLLEELISVGEQHFEKDSNWIVDRISLIKMLNQAAAEASFNFRHGSTYLTPSIQTAVRYALDNNYGSELLSHALDLFVRLRKFDPSAAAGIAARYPQAIEILPRGKEPLLVEVRDVAIRQLRSESGQDASTVLEKMQRTADAFDAEVRDSLWQQLNFELTETLPADQIVFYRIIPLGIDPVFPPFKLQPL